MDLGIIDKAGSWYTLNISGHDPVKVQGAENMYRELLTKPDMSKMLETKVYEAMKA
jgi:hypothetical protein